MVNFELPEVAESYVHRIGRTARAGLEGVAISLCDNSERSYLRAIEKLTNQSIPCTDLRLDRNAPEEAPPPRGGAKKPQPRSGRVPAPVRRAMPSRAASTDVAMARATTMRAPMARAMKARALASALASSAPVRKAPRPRKTARGRVLRGPKG